MTLTIHATVYSIETNGDGNSVVSLSADNAVGDETVDKSYKNAAGEIVEYKPAQITCNTEGKVIRAMIHLVVEGNEPPVEMGQVLSFTSHFDRKIAVARSADEEESAQAED